MTKNHDIPNWEQIEVAKPYGEYYMARMGFPEFTDRLLIAIDSSGSRHFLILLEKGEVFVTNFRSEGIMTRLKDLRVHKGPINTQEKRYIDIQLINESERDIFDIIGRQIALSLSDQSQASSDCVTNVLARWRNFWSSPSLGILSKEEIIGLFSELWFITKWILPFSPRALLYGWRGPYGGRHDFEWTGISVEVKGTTTVNGIRHWVNNIEQLSPPENGKLYLFSLKMREEKGANTTLPDLVTKCIESVKRDQELLEFMNKSLLQSGYSPMHDNIYKEYRFHVVDEALYIVDGRFPRITSFSFSDRVPEGIEQIRYQINLEGFGNMIVTKHPIKGFFSEADKI